MTYEAIWQQQASDILFQNAITIIGKRWNYVLPKSTQWDSKETSIDKTFTCWTLFILETVINYSLLPPLKFHLGSRHFLLLLQKAATPAKAFQLWTQHADWLTYGLWPACPCVNRSNQNGLHCGGRWTRLSPKPQQVACVWVVHKLSITLPPYTHGIN